MKYLFASGLFVILTVFLVGAPVHAAKSTEKVRGEIQTMSDTEVTVRLLEGDEKGSVYPVMLFDEKQIVSQDLSPGDQVLVSFMRDAKGADRLVIVDQYRLNSLIVLFAFFVGVVIVIGRRKGFFSFLAMAFSFLVIVQFIVLQILLGNDPLLISLIAALLIIPATFYISHGFSTKTTFAVVSTFIILVITGILAFIFVYLAKLTGYAADEATFINMSSGGVISIQGLLLVGIVIGAMGVLDDITISQTAIVAKLRKANPKYTKWELFRESMDVGRDHIASLVNTLVLVYAGAALPLFVLFSSTEFGTLSQVLNMEIVATEIVRTLVSSIGIVSAVPITTVLAVWKNN